VDEISINFGSGPILLTNLISKCIGPKNKLYVGKPKIVFVVDYSEGSDNLTENVRII